MFFSRFASILFHVVISKILNKKKRVKFTNVFENINFFRDAKMFDDNAKLKNMKKDIDFCDIKNLNQFEINFFK